MNADLQVALMVMLRMVASAVENVMALSPSTVKVIRGAAHFSSQSSEWPLVEGFAVMCPEDCGFSD
ncbi:hypothetical protein [Xylella taiwanensis]|uniref:Secreted protein n=1 Tax=Xylella taiwanensis TaxID=1444770 RepID=A0ABS8TVN3_9GAMM|nr:hypothetical protein [Xylella taiwanensis]MCD8457316.1 hypothetical protein [Xylella taiwanensis]MCD8459727.1 hypothetical protein [Xylella taiwanensis]MCD8462566.1 hypothetical protein [Xylella taiwanensis]MCD8466352.1 hypothetical protein [Xylella taiwanensis]MCD8472554.1 hypothetical protein [Xylella taiwanensis]